MITNNALMLQISAISRQAGLKIMEHFGGSRASRAKQDRSPVTDADMEAHHFITAELKALTPEIPIISEEDEEIATLRSAPRYWLVDPLDGTRSFVSGSGEFTVNIGLIERNYPVMGAIYAPKQDALYMGAAGIGAFKQVAEAAPQPIHARPAPPDGMTAIKSSQHSSPRMEEFLKKYPIQELASASSSIKFCILAEGAADFYPRLGRTMEWDTCAGQAILEAAGGRVETLEGERFYYSKPGFENPGFMAFGK